MKYSKNGQNFAMSKNALNVLIVTCWTLCKKPHFTRWSGSRYTFFWMTRYVFTDNEFVCSRPLCKTNTTDDFRRENKSIFRRKNKWVFLSLAMFIHRNDKNNADMHGNSNNETVNGLKIAVILRSCLSRKKGLKRWKRTEGVAVGTGKGFRWQRFIIQGTSHSCGGEKVEHAHDLWRWPA